MRIRLHEKFDWRIPGKRAMQAFPVGDHTMTHEAGAEAIRQGKGKEIEKPRKELSPHPPPERYVSKGGTLT